jgi:D-glycero-D-manno-heptose 1,7-bisphosphate phosphatase
VRDVIIVDPPGPVRLRPATPQRCLFLDRDGVINFDHGWVHKIEDVEWVDGIFELARAAIAAKYIIVVVTNQAGIARGLYDESAFRLLSLWMSGEFARRDLSIARIIGCPHHPDGTVAHLRQSCGCRKPQPGMLLHASIDLNIDLAASVMVGDSVTDMQAAAAAGVRHRVLLVPRSGALKTSQSADLAWAVSDSLLEIALDFIPQLDPLRD